MCSSSDVHWTLLGFTDTTGQPIICGIIFKGESLTPKERLGFDIFAPVVEPQDCIVHLQPRVGSIISQTTTTS